jgi:hypothetical protein
MPDPIYAPVRRASVSRIEWADTQHVAPSQIEAQQLADAEAACNPEAYRHSPVVRIGRFRLGEEVTA